MRRRAPEAARSRLPGLWRHRDFLLPWGGQAVSETGSAVTLLALPLTAVVVLHASALRSGCWPRWSWRRSWFSPCRPGWWWTGYASAG